MVAWICYAETADVFPGLVARNKAVIEYERFVHRNFYPHVIHPYSRFRVAWEIALLFIIPLRLVVSTPIWIFPLTPVYFIILSLFQLLNIVDIFLSFFTGYVEFKTDIVILSQRKIFLNYFFKRFIFDLIPCVPNYLILYLLYVRYDSFKLNHLYSLFYVNNSLMFLRAVSFFLYLNHVSSLFQWYPFFLGIIATLLALFFVFLFHIDWLFFTYFIAMDEVTLARMLSQSLSYKTDIFLNQVESFLMYLNDSSYVQFQDYMRFTFLFLLFFCNIMFIVYLIKFMLLKMENTEKLFYIESRIMYFTKQNFPASLKQKIVLYFLILLENKHCKDIELFDYIPDTFRAEIFFHLCLPLLKTFQPFDNFPTYVLRRLAECMTYQLHLPNEVVMAKQEIRVSMYFISRGTVALYSGNQVELYHFEAGSSINGNNFIMGQPNRNHYAISIEIAEVYRLDYDKYKEIMVAHPKLFRSITRKSLPHAFKTGTMDLPPWG